MVSTSLPSKTTLFAGARLTHPIENAFKLAFMAYKQRERGNADFTSSEMGEHTSAYGKRE